MNQSRRTDLLDPRKVAELYLRDRFPDSQAARAGQFGIREVREVDLSYVHVAFDGAHDVRSGILSLFRYGFQASTPNDIWYVARAESRVLPRGGPELGDKYEDGKLVQTFIPRVDGTIDLHITELKTGRTLFRTQLAGKAPHLMEIKRDFGRHYIIHLEARFKGVDGALGIAEFTAGSGIT